MKVLNLTPHSVEVFEKLQFVNLQNPAPSVYTAENVTGDPLVSYPSKGVARISTSESSIASKLPGKTVKTSYGEISGIPSNVSPDTVLIVSMPTQTAAQLIGHPLASQMVIPSGVVRDSKNKSRFLGCMGLSY